MNFGFDVRTVFPVDVVSVGSDLVPRARKDGAAAVPVWAPHAVPSVHVLQQRVCAVLDALGESSARAQDLRAAVTSADRLRHHDDHTVYILTDVENNCVVGLIKVGRKKLFLLDRCGRQHESSPLCLLDFYVHESRQRTGCGLRLFEHMLNDQRVEDPAFLAIDRPSHKLVAFLAKHFALTQKVPQVNNYVVFDKFFSNNNNDKECEAMKRPRIYMGKLQYV